ncbi:uncharacterized protein LOC110851026 isoform X2 [Folsomia candida]|uniref:uncharacterized protein LOC110851026 isoform X2 n=1 Tax=Folsomia candida TaxID=158441 RepID=UPI000B907F99|nr:uncharacterized protein LOC110851026 isoform X2 [Folsomia candida]
MNFSWISLCISFLLHSVRSAPAVSSVHVSFVAGNKATEYSHGIGGSSPLLHYNHNHLRHHGGKRDELGESHVKRKRSTHESTTSVISPTNEAISTSPTILGTSTTAKIYKKNKSYSARVPINPKFGRKHLTNKMTSTTRASDDELATPTTISTTTSTTAMIDESNPSSTASTTSSPLLKRILRPRVKFVESRPTVSGVEENVVTTSEDSLRTTTSDILRGESTKPKDSKAVKRSPFIGDNFETGGIQFPDFDDFGGDDFGSLRNFAGGRGGGHRGNLAAHAHANPEALSPDGVFLPPIPTEASDYADSDPYLADPDTAKYAAQHPPFFAAFPHKRTVLALNDQRVHNGLEPNFLRSIRPYFAFFDAANPHKHGHGYIKHKVPYHHHRHHYLSSPDFEYPPSHPPVAGPPPPPPISYSYHSDSSSDLFGGRHGDHNQLLYAESDILRTKPGLTLWSIFSTKK